jgi:hypothetical protein
VLLLRDFRDLLLRQMVIPPPNIFMCSS